MKKVVFKVDLQDVKYRRRAMKIVTGVSGVDSVSLDRENNTLTVTGDFDLVKIAIKLRKRCEILSVGPAEVKQDEKNKEEEDKDKNFKAEVTGIRMYHGSAMQTEEHPYFINDPEQKQDKREGDITAVASYNYNYNKETENTKADSSWKNIWNLKYSIPNTCRYVFGKSKKPGLSLVLGSSSSDGEVHPILQSPHGHYEQLASPILLPPELLPSLDGQDEWTPETKADCCKIPAPSPNLDTDQKRDTFTASLLHHEADQTSSAASTKLYQAAKETMTQPWKMQVSLAMMINPYHCNYSVYTQQLYVAKSPSFQIPAHNFVSLFLPYCKLNQLWKGDQQLPLVNLKSIDLAHSSLLWIPDLSKAQKLESLNLQGCENLVGVSTIQYLTNLQHLNLKRCRNLKGLPTLIRLKLLKTLDLSFCSNITSLPPSLGCLTNLSELNLRNCVKLEHLPLSVIHLMASLETLNVSDCSRLWESLISTREEDGAATISTQQQDRLTTATGETCPLSEIDGDQDEESFMATPLINFLPPELISRLLPPFDVSSSSKDDYILAKRSNEDTPDENVQPMQEAFGEQRAGDEGNSFANMEKDVIDMIDQLSSLSCDENEMPESVVAWLAELEQSMKVKGAQAENLKEVDARLAAGGLELSFLDAELSRILVEEEKTEAELQRLMNKKSEMVQH